MYKASQEAEEKHAADTAEAAERGKLLDAARAADAALRQAEADRAPVTELHRLAKELDAALTAAMRAAYAAQRAEIGPRGYEDRIFHRKAKAKPAVRVLAPARPAWPWPCGGRSGPRTRAARSRPAGRRRRPASPRSAPRRAPWPAGAARSPGRGRPRPGAAPRPPPARRPAACPARLPRRCPP